MKMKIAPPPGKANRRSFRMWLNAQVGREDPVGDLANDALRQSSGTWISHSDLRAKMRTAGACAEAMQALEDARKEFAAGEVAHFAAKRKPAPVAVVRAASDPVLQRCAEMLFEPPCPFCGDFFAGLFEARWEGLDFGTGEYSAPVASVRCPKCSAAGPEARGATMDEAKAAALAAWGRRVAPRWTS
jgi:hypothetical protein